jgi:hypothetical protein
VIAHESATDCHALKAPGSPELALPVFPTEDLIPLTDAEYAAGRELAARVAALADSRLPRTGAR